MENLLILGAADFGFMVKEIAEEMGCFERIEFLDDNKKEAIGAISDYKKFIGDFQCAIVAIGNSEVRKKLLEQLLDAGYKIATICSPYAYVSKSAQIMNGAIVEPGAVVQANSVVGKGSIISSGSVVRHNAIVGEYCHCDCNSTILSNATLPPNIKIHCGTVYPANLSVTNRCPDNYTFEDGF